MEDNFVVECFFDTILIKAILKTKKINHKKGCPNVVKEIESGKLKDDFAVGIIDRDKREFDYIKDKFNEIEKFDNLVLLKHKTKQHYFILIVPAIESWILKVAEEGGVNIEKFGLSKDLNKLKQETKTMYAEKNQNLLNLCKQLVGSEGKTIKKLADWLNYLYIENRNADINKLKENV